MTVSEAIQNRRSIRRYEPDFPVSKEHIREMLEAAMMAPSAGNTRPWEFYVVESRKAREQIAAASPYGGPIREAPLAIVICALPEKQKGGPDAFWPQDCGAAIQNLLLKALELGYGTCWCGLYPREERAKRVQEILSASSIPLAAIAVGKAAESPEARGYYEERKVHYLK